MMRALTIAGVTVALAGLLVYKLTGSASEDSTTAPVKASAAQPAAVDQPPAAAETGAVERATADRAPSAAKSPGESVPVEKTADADAPAKDVTFDDVKLELKKGDPYDPALLTDKIKKLDGKSIRIRGYILPSFQQSNIKQFVLVRDNQECCFGPGALLHDCIIVEMSPPAAATFTVRPISVEGVFSIRELKLDGKYLAIYHLDGKDVK
jgi:hypothetical protein